MVSNTSNEPYRDFDPSKDQQAVARIWQECGWIDDVKKEADSVKLFFDSGDAALVALIDDTPECAVLSTPGTMRYLNETLPMGAVSAVTTSHIARKRGFASHLTARLLAKQAAAGHIVSALGMFEQGFYDKLGFGSGSYEQYIRFDPSQLITSAPYRTPKRLTEADAPAMYQAMLNRDRSHGGVTIDSLDNLRGELSFTEEPYGLGYYNELGELTHFIWGEAKGEHGPYTISMRAYQNKAQLLELLTLCKSLADQVNTFETLEFGELQLQDLLKQPLRGRRGTAQAKFAQSSNSFAYWQARILNLEACLEKTHLLTPNLKFNLQLTDPVTEYLDASSNWQGIAGDYCITLGQESSAVKGFEIGLPLLQASVNSFTRLWLGVRPASHLYHSTDLNAPMALITKLDAHLCLPKPHLGWDF